MVGKGNFYVLRFYLPALQATVFLVCNIELIMDRCITEVKTTVAIYSQYHFRLGIACFDLQLFLTAFAFLIRHYQPHRVRTGTLKSKGWICLFGAYFLFIEIPLIGKSR